MSRRVGLGLLLLIVLLVAGVTPVRADDGGADFFEQHVRPVLVAKCLECHGPDEPPQFSSYTAPKSHQGKLAGRGNCIRDA